MIRAVPDYRRAKVTDESKAEADRLKALWEAATGRPNQAVFGELYDIGSQSAVNFFLNGKTPLSLKAARGFARGLRCSIGDFSPRLAAEAAKNAEFLPPAEEQEFVDVARVDVNLAAGDGATVGIEETVGHLKFTRSFLRSIGVSAASAKVVNVTGPSMEPTIRDGAVLLVSTSNREPRNDAVFALVRPAEGLIVKRLVRSGKGWIARSDNREFADIPIGHGEPVTIIGRAHWMGVKL